MYRPEFQHLAALERRRIPGNAPTDMRLHRLERPQSWPAEFVREVWASVPEGLLNQYPDYATFYARLAAFIGQPAERIVVGAGIEDFIRTLTFLCCGAGDTVAFTWPTCAMFDIYAQAFGARAHHLIVNPDNPPGVDEVAKCLPSELRLLILPNPGQPVDTCFGLPGLRHIAKRCKTLGAVFAIDEAYHGFGAPSAMPLVEEFDNVLVLRTFSKAFGAASIRVGYAVGQPAVIKPLDAVRASGEVSGPSMWVATALMDHWHDVVEPGILAVCKGRDWLRDDLNREGIKAQGRFANHVLVDWEDADRAQRIASALAARGVFVRDGFPSPLDRHTLITCGDRALMMRFAQELAAVL